MRIGNTKLNLEIINKLIKYNANSIEIDLILHLSKFQNEFGVIEGIYYQDVCLVLNITKQSFYNAINSLCDKEIIQAINDRSATWTITINNNMFRNKEDDKKGYLNINKQIFSSNKFRDLKAKEKLLCLKLLLVKRLENEKNFKVYPETLKNWISIQSSTLIYDYLENIKCFFNYEIKKSKKNTNIVIFKENTTAFLENKETARELFLRHKIVYFLRKYNINYVLKDIKDIITLVNQYSAKKGIMNVFRIICDVIMSARSVESKLINYYLSDKKTDKSKITPSSKINKVISNVCISNTTVREKDIQCFVKNRFNLKIQGINIS